MPSLAVFAYGSLVDRDSAGQTLGRDVERVWPARLGGWRRRFSQARDNATCEKTFARADDGSVPAWILGLNLEPSDRGPLAPNGALIAVSEVDLERLDVREIRYQRREVGSAVAADPGCPQFDRVITYVARPAHHAPQPPSGAVILSSYARAVEDAFDRLGGRHGSEYRRTTLPHPVELVDGVLIEDRIPPGNPRDW
jgi:cation transport regulator ChaC